MRHSVCRCRGRLLPSPRHQARGRRERCSTSAAPTDDPLLLRVARGEEGERTPVWLMRQAGRYMEDFRKYSDKYPFRVRSETPDIAVKLSLQPYRAFQTDAVIMFSDILTPLPAMGIEFDVIKGIGPRIENPMRTVDDLRQLRPLSDPNEKLGFVGETLQRLRAEIRGGPAALVGFIGTPWTLAAYCVEGKASKNCLRTKTMMRQQPELLHQFLRHLTESLTNYVHYQVESGAQIVQLFDSWAHQLSPDQFSEFSLPYVESIVQSSKTRHPEVPIVFHMNGDVIGIDWHVDMKTARSILPDRVLQGNVDPLELCGTKETLSAAVKRCLEGAGGRHILNVGHGVIQQTPEDHVRLFCDLAKNSVQVGVSPPRPDLASLT